MHSNSFILASQSPRRKQLLSEAGYDFEVKTIPYEEHFQEGVAGDQMAEYLATEKNMAHRYAFKDAIILTADTVVLVNNQALGKPGNRAEAIEMIGSMVGKTHQVISAVCISSNGKQVVFSSSTEVKFHPMEDHEVAYYVDTFKPYDKAGAYGIQEWIGLVGIEWIRGSYYNVVGLPVDKVYRSLKDDFNILPQ